MFIIIFAVKMEEKHLIKDTEEPHMIAEKMKPLVQNNSAIRAMFEEGKRLAGIYGAENVYDFSLGNPNVPAPEAIKTAIMEILNEEESTFIH